VHGRASWRLNPLALAPPDGFLLTRVPCAPHPALNLYSRTVVRPPGLRNIYTVGPRRPVEPAFSMNRRNHNEKEL